MRAAFFGAKRVPRTAGGVPIPSGWALQRLDTFGSAGSIPGPVRAHALYFEGATWTRNADGSVTIPNGVINNQQQTYQHFEDATWVWATASDHMTIQARGQGDNSIKSGQLVPRGLNARSFIFEARVIVPSASGTWMEFWAYANTTGGDTSELDVEAMISTDGTSYTAHDVTLNNHPNLDLTTGIDDLNCVYNGGTGIVKYSNAGKDLTAGPHYFTIYYDDTGSGTVRRYIDGVLTYHGTWKWNNSLGGTGFGPDATAILDFAAGSGASGGNFPGTIASPSTFSGNMDIYSLGVYTPGSVGRAIPAGEAWNYNFKTPSITLSGNDLIATATATTSCNVYALDPMTSGKYYWEVLLSSGNAAAGVGTYNSDATSGNYLGQNNESVGWYGAGGAAGLVLRGGSTVATWATYSGTPQRLCFALHVVPGGVCKLWGRVGTAGNWNNDVIGNQNPNGDVGGYTLPFTSYLLPAGYTSTTGDTVTLVAASGSWAGTPPTGYGQIGPT